MPTFSPWVLLILFNGGLSEAVHEYILIWPLSLLPLWCRTLTPSKSPAWKADGWNGDGHKPSELMHQWSFSSVYFVITSALNYCAFPIKISWFAVIFAVSDWNYFHHFPAASLPRHKALWSCALMPHGNYSVIAGIGRWSHPSLRPGRPTVGTAMVTRPRFRRE